ncbi:MAG: hypothetical protein COU06_00885 [Candidatus Harrisonbacteria bacterium CG10_big_fil_rev_8_21_14_0_10_38_8]|uniref:Uncharacterized protein n=1 Tax=Candidatus Harrisonbacteria bacterium CG10_big_fil_rev_8_21_14_0_10_38_8 TaxID=1974582 RepID=A0A2M6WKD6_9BACT|nr:MAG: hypothetical protein COU06_00885 [Candidatus Harrisonbacteria bacterium CG10_big_fil_rev_8_21_14_0_10_38_8]
MDSIEKNNYLSELNKRSQNKRVTTDYQLTGLEVAMMLRDMKHKALYIKLAKQHGSDKIIAIAKTVLERKDIKNPGAYFMTLTKNL